MTEQKQNFDVFCIVKIISELVAIRHLCRWMQMLLFLPFLASFSTSAATFTAALDRDSTSVGESVTLSVTVEGGSLKGNPELPSIPGVRISSSGTSQNFSFINGKSTSQTVYSYTLVPTQPGEINIPPIKARVDGTPMATGPLKLKVAAPSPSSGTTPDGQPAEAFLKLIVPKTEIYVGEVVPVEVRLYFQYVKDASLPQVQADGFIMSPLSQKPEQSQVQINNSVYNLAVFRFSLSPTKTGRLTFGPATCSLVILSGAQRSFFGELVFSRSRPATLTSETFTINALPLPQQDQPSTFNGAVGNFSLNVNAGPSDVAVGDPITVKIAITGRGTLDSLTLPAQPAWREFKTYPPTSNIESTDALHLEGTKTFEWIVSPQNAGVKELPSLVFSFFDPEQKQYRTLSGPSIPLHVRSTVATPQPTVFSSEVPQPPAAPAKEIVHIKPNIGTLRPAAAPLITQPWFWATQSAAPLLWIGAILYRRHREKLNRNPRLRRQREVARLIEAGMQQLQRCSAENKSEEFFATAFRLLQEQIGERLDLPASAITESVIEERELRDRGLHSEAATLIAELFQVCNQARYASIRGTQQLQSFIPQIEKALSELKKLKDEKLPVTV